MIVKGKVTKITNFGVFVELEDDLEGLLHISELADHKVENPHDIVTAEQELEVKILRVDLEDRKIGLSLKRAQWTNDDSGRWRRRRSVRQGPSRRPPYWAAWATSTAHWAPTRSPSGPPKQHRHRPRNSSSSSEHTR